MEKLKSHLKELGLKPELDKLLSYIENFLLEMKNGLNNKESSLKMIPSYLEVTNINKDDECLVIDAGGTNLRSAIINIGVNTGYSIKSYKSTTLPGVKKEYTKNDFFKYIYNFIKDDIKNFHNIGFCFSYPMEKYPNKDGKLIRWTKEIKAPEVIGSMIGDSLNEVIINKNHNRKKIILLNDTVASLYAGVGNSIKRNYKNFIGLIVGTGCNTAYIEDSTNIAKLNKTKIEMISSQVINIESGNFDEIDITEIDKLLNKETQYPYTQVLEKMVSGKYLSRLIYHLTKILINEKIIKNFDNICEMLESVTIQEISEWVYYGNKCKNNFSKKLYKFNPSNKQLMVLSTIINTIIDRAASYVAMKLAAIIHKKNKGKTICNPTLIVAEGPVIESLPGFRKKVDKYLLTLLEQLGEYYYDIIHIENANIIGGGIATSINK